MIGEIRDFGLDPSVRVLALKSDMPLASILTGMWMDSEKLILRRSSSLGASNNKTTPAIPRVGKIGKLGSANVDPDSPSPQQNRRSSLDRSPKSADSKPTAERHSPKTGTPVKQPRSLKGSELLAQLTLLQEELKKAKEELATEEEEKCRILQELKEAKKMAEVANGKLDDAVMAQKLAEECSELDKFRADELEQSAIEAAQKREEEWQMEIENVRNQNAIDIAAFLSATEELRRVKQELVMTAEAKNTALAHAEDAMKIAEFNAEKVEKLSEEICHLESLLASEVESKSKESAELIKRLELETEVVKLELFKKKRAEEKFINLETLLAGLKIDVTNAKAAESDALGLVDDWKKKVELLESQLKEASQSESSMKNSLFSAIKQLEEREAVCDEAESEVTSLKGKIDALELEAMRHKSDLKESDQRLDLAMQEMLDMEKTAEILKSEIQRVLEEKAQALHNEKFASLNVESLSLENNKLVIELEITKEESQKAKKAMEGLSSALNEVSTEARDTTERLSIKLAELENATTEVEELKSALKNTQEKYELILDEAKYEIVCLKKAAEKYEAEVKDLRAEWDLKEFNLISAIKKSEEELVSIKLEMDNAMDTLKRQKDEAKAAQEEISMLFHEMRRAESDLITYNKSLKELKMESQQLKESLLDKENELQSITQENEELRVRATAASETIQNLSNLLAEATFRNNKNGTRQNEENGGGGELSNSGKVYDIFPMAIESMQEKVDKTEAEKVVAPSGKVEVVLEDRELEAIDNDNGNTDENHNVNGIAEEEESLNMELVYDGNKTIDKQLSLEWELDSESMDEEPDSKLHNSNLDHVNEQNAENGNTLPNKQQQQQPNKKKPLLHKLGTFLKKKSNPK